jgi:hypothetical protein
VTDEQRSGAVRLAELRAHGPVRTHTIRNLHAGNWFKRFNAKIGLGVTVSVGTMWCAYTFAALALVSLPAAIASGNAVILVSWLSQTFLQLVLLSIIIVGQNIQAQASDTRSEQTFKDAEALLVESTEIRGLLTAQAADTARLREAFVTLLERLDF